MLVKITKEIHYGNPGERRILPIGATAELVPATNLPANGFWAHPVDGWPQDTVNWANDVGVFVQNGEFEKV